MKRMKSWKMIGLLVFVLTSMWATTNGAWGADRTMKETISDASITTSVKTRLLADKRTDGLKIDVDTQSGVVYLSGVVPNAEQIKVAEAIAKQVEGVKSVENNLQVK